MILGTGFNYDFDSFKSHGKPNELNEALKEVLEIPEKLPVLRILRNFFPVLRVIVGRLTELVERSIIHLPTCYLAR